MLERLENADAVILGSPIYLGNFTGEMRSFMERYIFPYITYSIDTQTFYPKNIPVGFIYTMNITEDLFELVGINKLIESNEWVATRIFGYSEPLCSTDTYQFDDYSKYVSSIFNPQEKAKRREEVFPQDCQKAFEMGARFVKRQKALKALK